MFISLQTIKNTYECNINSTVQIKRYSYDNYLQRQKTVHACRSQKNTDFQHLVNVI